MIVPYSSMSSAFWLAVMPSRPVTITEPSAPTISTPWIARSCSRDIVRVLPSAMVRVAPLPLKRTPLPTILAFSVTFIWERISVSPSARVNAASSSLPSPRFRVPARLTLPLPLTMSSWSAVTALPAAVMLSALNAPSAFTTTSSSTAKEILAAL